MNNAQNAYNLRVIAWHLAAMGTDETTVAVLMHEGYKERVGY